MKWLKIEYIKAHSRICCDGEDAILEMYADSAEETIASYLNRGTLDECDAWLREQYGGVPNNIIHAALMLVDVSYTYRSPVNPTNVSLVPYTFDLLIKPYMKL